MTIVSSIRITILLNWLMISTCWLIITFIIQMLPHSQFVNIVVSKSGTCRTLLRTRKHYIKDTLLVWYNIVPFSTYILFINEIHFWNEKVWNGNFCQLIIIHQWLWNMWKNSLVFFSTTPNLWNPLSRIREFVEYSNKCRLSHDTRVMTHCGAVRWVASIASTSRHCSSSFFGFALHVC